MKQLIILPLPQSCDKQNLDSVAETLFTIKPQAIDVLNWKEYSYKPEVSFRLAYDNENLYLRYDVREKYIRARATQDNGEVWLDSCVEFFLSPEGNDTYYNFEFNCIGTKLLGYRKLGDSTQHGSPEIMQGICCRSSLANQALETKTGDFSWNLVAVIPLSSFWAHSLLPLKGKQLRANFYKCGDELPEAHFLSWNPIGTDAPSFHQPGFFGELLFQ